MSNRSENQINVMLNERKRRRWQFPMLLCLAILVAVGVAGIFHLPATAKTYQVTRLTCSAVPPTGEACADFFVHIHNDDCYDTHGNLVCPLPEIRPHRHTSDCYITTRELVCVIPESDGHQHTADCYTRVKGDLICELPTEAVLDEEGNVLEEGHVHTDECYAWYDELICGMEEGEGAHHHDDSCYETYTTLICDRPEILLHTHTEDCYETDADGNVYLVCGQMQVLEHVHGPECFTTYELDDGEPEAVFMEAEEQPEEGGNQETETADDGVTDDSNPNPADDKPSDIDEAGDTDTKDTTTDTTDTTTETNTETTTDTTDTTTNTTDTTETTTETTTDATETNTDQENQKAADDEELPAAEEPHTVTYTGTRGAEKGGMTALAEIPEGALDANAQLVLGDADESAARMLILKVVNEFAAEGEERDISSMLVMDIGFAANGAPAAPQGPDPIRVTLRAAAIRGMSAPKMFHLAGGTAQEVKDVLFDTQAGTAVFTSADFSPFAIVDLTGEDAAEETAEDPVSVSMPARDFHEATDEIEVFVSAPEGAFPAGTTMHVTAVPQEDVIGALNEAANGVMVRNVQAVDISFRNAADEEIEPRLPISVKMSRIAKEQPTAAEAVPEGKESVVLHVDNDGSAKIVEDANVTDTEAEFESNRFSTYIMADFLTEEVIASNGENYRITVTYGAAAGIPQGAELRVQEIVPTAPENEAEPAPAGDTYGEYLAKTESALPANQKVTYARFFDITILLNGEEIQPQAPVAVTVELADELATEEIKAVHFAQKPDEAEQPVLLDAASSEASTQNMTKAVSFEASGFSVYGIVGTETVTVDFLTADGKTLTIRVTFDHREVLPAGAMLDVSEVIYEENPDGYAQRNERLAGVLFEKYGNVAITDVRYLNISVMVPDENLGGSVPTWVEYEPVYPMEVKIRYTEPMDTTNPGEYEDYNDGAMKVTPDIGNHIVGVHYTDDGAEILETLDANSDMGVTETVTYTDGFSEYDFAYVYEYEIIDTNYDYEPSPISTMALASKPTLMASTSTSGGLLRGTGDTPDHSKTLSDNHDGTTKLSLTVTGDADTDNNTASNANVIIVFDTSNSMINYYVPMVNGARGSNNEDGSNSFVLYRNTNGTEADDGYIGTVYSRTRYGNQYYYTEYTGQRYSKTIRRADAAEKVLYDFAHALFAYKNTEDDPSTPVDERQNIQAALITFNVGATTVQNWTSTETDITNRVSSTGAGGSKKLGNASGTNWEAALQRAQTVVGTADNDPTFVVFITDGQPTQWVGQTSRYDTTGEGYEHAMDEARALQLACAATGTDSHGALFGIYAYGTEADYLDDLMHYAYTGTARTASADSDPAEGYYNAADSTSLTEAINDIFSKIVSTLGVTAVSIQDGTTSQVQTTSGEISHLLEVDTGSYEYWLSFPTVDNKIKMKDLVTGEDVECTVSSSGSNVTISWSKGGTNYSETYEGTYSAGTARIKWDRATSFYNYAPPAASFTDPSVDWNLSSLGTLLDGVTYEVTFDVYPSQETLDLIADLKNEKIHYEELDANIKQYLIQNGNEYTLKTNTSASLTYTDTRTEVGSQTAAYENPNPVSTSAVESLAITKRWENALDSRTEESVELEVTRDGEDRYEVILNERNRWTSSAYTSIGIMTVHNGVVSVKTTGHDFSFAEPENMSYRWELDVPTVHPMKINGKDTILVQVTGDDIPSAMTTLTSPAQYESNGVTYYKMNYLGADRYYKVDNSLASLTATNTRRSTLNVTKTVTGSNAPADALFDFTVKIIDTNNDDVWFSILDGSNYVTNTDEVTYISGATAETNSETGELTGYYYAPSGTQITFKLKAGWNLRFTNLPTDSQYEVTESSTMPDECFEFVSVVGKRDYYTYTYSEDGTQQTVPGQADTGTVTGQKIEGTIANTNSTYTMTYTNKYDAAAVTVTKSVTGYDDDSEFEIIATVTQNGAAVTSLPTQSDSKVSAVEGRSDQLKITLKNGETATLNLKEGMSLSIAETENPKYTAAYSYKLTADGEEQTGNTIASVSDGNAMTVTNTANTVDIYLEKVAKGSTTPLPGSEFKLYRKNSGGAYATDETIEATKESTILTLTDGTLTIPGLPSGDYKLTEKKAPDGYIIQTRDIYFTVNASGETIITTTTGQDDFTTVGASTKGTKNDTLIIPNTPGVELPQTGGEGTLLFSVFGTILVLSSALLILAKRKQEAYTPRH